MFRHLTSGTFAKKINTCFKKKKKAPFQHLEVSFLPRDPRECFLSRNCPQVSKEVWPLPAPLRSGPPSCSTPFPQRPLWPGSGGQDQDTGSPFLI